MFESLLFLTEVVLDIVLEVSSSEPKAQTDHLPDLVIDDVLFLCEAGDTEDRIEKVINESRDLVLPISSLCGFDAWVLAHIDLVA